MLALAVSADRQTELLRRPFLMTQCATLGDVRLIFGGHSHCHAICRALLTGAEAEEQTDPRAAGLAHGLAGLMGVGQGVDMRGQLVALAQHRDMALVWRGNQHNGDFLMMPGQVLELLPRGYPDRSVLPAAQIVSEEAVRANRPSARRRPRWDSTSLRLAFRRPACAASSGLWFRRSWRRPRRRMARYLSRRLKRRRTPAASRASICPAATFPTPMNAMAGWSSGNWPSNWPWPEVAA